jgi:hypothetical protein
MFSSYFPWVFSSFLTDEFINARKSLHFYLLTKSAIAMTWQTNNFSSPINKITTIKWENQFQVQKILAETLLHHWFGDHHSLTEDMSLDKRQEHLSLHLFTYTVAFSQKRKISYYWKVIPLDSMPIYNLQIMRAEFWGKRNKVYYSSDEEDRESQPFKHLLSHVLENMSAF